MKKDIFKDAETLSKALESIINKAVAKKDDPDVPQEYKVEMFEFVSPEKIGTKENSGYNLVTEVRDIKTKKTYYLHDREAEFKAFNRFKGEDSSLENIFFIVHKANQELGIKKKIKDGRDGSLIEGIFLNISGDINKNVMIFNTNEDNWSDYTNKKGRTLIDIQLSYIDGGYESSYGVRICDLIATYSGLTGSPEISQGRSKIKGLGLDKLPGIAKVFGYEIPDNYAPGQGVEMKKKE